MSQPNAYDPQDGYRFQILCRNQSYSREWEACDHATDRADKTHLLTEYRLAYGAGWEFKVITLPRKFWPPQRSFNVRLSPSGREITPIES